MYEKLVRLENTRFGFETSEVNEIDKILVFDPQSGTLKIYLLPKPIPFEESSLEEKLSRINRILGIDFSENSPRIIQNSPIPGAYSAPFKIYLDITSACELNCPFCLTRKKKVNLSLSYIKKIAEEIRKLGIMYVKIGGGDPLLHPEFKVILQIIRESGAFITMSINSMRVTPEIAKLLKRFNVRTSVSIEGMENTNDRFRGKGHFKTALKTLSLLKQEGVEVLLRVTLLRENLREVPELVKLAIAKGVKIKFSYCRPAGYAVDNQMVLGPEDAKEYLQAIEYINRPEISPYVLMDEGMMFQQPFEIYARLYRGRMCGAANRSMHINAEGEVNPCIFLGPSFTAGKLYQDGSIIDFWRENPIFKKTRDIPQPQECNNCERICKNECPANRLYFWGNFRKQDPNCLLEARKNAKLFGR